MIADRLEHAATYVGLGRGIAAALQYLQRTDVAALGDGRHEVADGIVAIVQRYAPKARAEAMWEAHRKNVDVQFVAGGCEMMGWRPSDSTIRVRKPYEDEADVEFFEEPSESTFLAVPAGRFVIFGPKDLHAPGLAMEGRGPSEEVLKVVVKVPVEIAYSSV